MNSRDEIRRKAEALPPLTMETRLDALSGGQILAALILLAGLILLSYITR